MTGRKTIPSQFHSKQGGTPFFASRRPEFDPVAQSTKRTGYDLKRSTVKLRLARAHDQARELALKSILYIEQKRTAACSAAFVLGNL
jgi:hypothetical protein